MTGQEFRDYVVRTFIRTDKDTEIYEATTDVVQMLMTSYPFDDFKTIKADASIASGNSFTLESDFLRFDSPMMCLDTDAGWELEQLTADDYERRFGLYNAVSTETGVPQAFCVVNGTVYVGPRPDVATYAYRYIYEYYQSAAIVAGTTTVPFTTINRKMLKHYVLGALYDELENQELANKHNAIGLAILTKMVDIDLRNTQGAITVKYQGA